MDKKNFSRNWAVEETNLFCEILIDYRSRYRFYDYIGAKVLKNIPQRKCLRRYSTNFKRDCLVKILKHVTQRISKEKEESRTWVRYMRVKYNNTRQLWILILFNFHLLLKKIIIELRRNRSFIISTSHTYSSDLN